MANLSLQHIYKIYPGDVTAVKDFNLEINLKLLGLNIKINSKEKRYPSRKD